KSATPTRPKAAVLVALSVGVILTSIQSGSVAFYPCVFGRLVYALAVTVLLWVGVSDTLPAFSWFLNLRVMGLVGTVSYSLYLWQQLFLYPTSPDWFMRWPINIAFALGLGVLSYLLIERPFLALKDRQRKGSEPRKRTGS